MRAMQPLQLQWQQMQNKAFEYGLSRQLNASKFSQSGLGQFLQQRLGFEGLGDATGAVSGAASSAAGAYSGLSNAATYAEMVP